MRPYIVEDEVNSPTMSENAPLPPPQLAAENPLPVSPLLFPIAPHFYLLVPAVGIVTITTALIVSIIGAISFIIFATGVALFVLLPLLCFAALLASTVGLQAIRGGSHHKDVLDRHITLGQGGMELKASNMAHVPSPGPESSNTSNSPWYHTFNPESGRHVKNPVYSAPGGDDSRYHADRRLGHSINRTVTGGNQDRMPTGVAKSQMKPPKSSLKTTKTSPRTTTKETKVIDIDIEKSEYFEKDNTAAQDNTKLIDALVSRDDTEAEDVFRSRPKIANSPTFPQDPYR